MRTNAAPSTWQKSTWTARRNEKASRKGRFHSWDTLPAPHFPCFGNRLAGPTMSMIRRWRMAPSRIFWAVLQADSTRKAAQRQRFPRSTKSTADDACGKPHRNQGPMAKSGPISCRTAQKSHGNRQREQGTEVCSERGLRLAKLHPEHTSVPCSPDQRHLNAGHPLSVCESFPARLPHGGLQRPDKPSMRSGCPPQDP